MKNVSILILLLSLSHLNASESRRKIIEDSMSNKPRYARHFFAGAGQGIAAVPITPFVAGVVLLSAPGLVWCGANSALEHLGQWAKEERRQRSSHDFEERTPAMTKEDKEAMAQGVGFVSTYVPLMIGCLRLIVKK